MLINYHEVKFVEALEHRADVILDVMGAKYLADNINSLAPDGRLVVIGMQGGVKAELNLGALLSKGDRRGDIPRGRSEASKAAICETVEREVADVRLRTDPPGH